MQLKRHRRVVVACVFLINAHAWGLLAVAIPSRNTHHFGVLTYLASLLQYFWHFMSIPASSPILAQLPWHLSVAWDGVLVSPPSKNCKKEVLVDHSCSSPCCPVSNRIGWEVWDQAYTGGWYSHSIVRPSNDLQLSDPYMLLVSRLLLHHMATKSGIFCSAKVSHSELGLASFSTLSLAWSLSGSRRGARSPTR